MNDLKHLKPWVESTAERMGESVICLNVFTDDYGKDVQSLIQFSLAIMMDKPIFLLAPKGRKIPKLVERIAEGIEFYNEGNKASMQAATTRLLTAAKQKGFAA
jgi:hypothetical protein